MNIDEMREKVIKDFSAHWGLNDPAHRIEHFSEVERCGHHINEVLDLGEKPKLIMLAAYFHDLFAWTRVNHEILSCEFVTSSDYSVFNDLLKIERTSVAIACLHHRASFKGTFTWKLDALINSADRMFPSENIDGLIHRSLVCSIHNVGRYKAVNATYEHVKEKFGSTGYARYPEMYVEVFKEELKQQQLRVDNLTLTDVDAIFDRIPLTLASLYPKKAK
jgi:hypothetical protein